MADENGDKKPTVVYVPFKTFLSAVETLEHGVPHVIDRTVWPSMSGVMQSQVLGAFRFLVLVDSEDKPTPSLELLVGDKDHRKEHLREILELSYTRIIEQDLTKMSVGGFDTAMREYGVTGETHRKACTFFLQAARYAGIPLSAYILKQTRNVSVNRKRRVASSNITPKGENSEDGLEETDNGVVPHGPTKTIELDNGITLSLSTSSDIFQISPVDRKFVIQLLEQLENYEGERAAAAQAEEEAHD
jgi:hypothetical protein